MKRYYGDKDTYDEWCFVMVVENNQTISGVKLRPNAPNIAWKVDGKEIYFVLDPASFEVYLERQNA